jgi:hypothetical protein
MHTNSKSENLAQPVGTAVRWGHKRFREQKSGSFNTVVSDCVAFGPLVVA